MFIINLTKPSSACTYHPTLDRCKEREKASMDEERIAWLRLKLTPELGNRSLLRLVRYFGSPAAVLRASAAALAAVPKLKENARSALIRKSVLRSPEAEWTRLEKEGIALLCLNDPHYPANLAA